MIEKIDEEELLLLQCLDDPISATECLFSDLENLTHEPQEQIAHLRLYQFPLLSSEYLLDYDNRLSKKENFKLREGAGNIDCFGGRKFGKCEYEENYCTLADGSRVKFKNLVNSERFVLSLNQKTLKLEKKLAKFRVNGLRKCLTIKTRKGKEITVTENHPLLTDRGWVLAKDLKLDDYIATPKHTNFGELKVDREKAILLGYLIGDGSCNSTNIEFTNINNELIEEFIDVCSFYDCDVVKHGEYGYRVRGKKRFFNVLGKPIANKVQQIVREYKIDCLAKEKLIPDEVFLWNKESLALFINRYFSCDGTINKSNNTISLTSASREMIYQMHSLLLKFDISSSIYYKRIKLNNKFFNSWNLNVLDSESCQKFIVEIGIKSKDYKFKLDLKENRSDSIPSSLILKHYEEFKYKKQLKLRKLKVNNFSRDKLKQINQLEKNSNIQKYIDSDILWDKVKNIETVKEKLETVIVSVEDNENYISNDIISHNSHCVETIDILISIFHLDHTEVGFTSTDAIHIRAILEEKLFPVITKHPFYEMFEPRINRSPNYRCAFKNGYTLIGINMNLGSKTPGQQFYGKHLKRLYVEEACVDGHTKIRFLDENDRLSTKNISELINSERYKNIKLLTYNVDSKKIETKKVNKIFKKSVKNAEVYEIKTDSVVGSSFKTLKVSKEHRLFVNDSYLTPDKVKVGDKMYLLDHCDLDDIQKQVLVGCLLGDSCLNKRVLNSLSIVHSVKQKPLLDYQKDCLFSLFDVFRKTKRNRHDFKKMKSFGDIVRYTSKESLVLKEFVDFKYCKKNTVYTKVDEKLLRKYLSPIALAFWIMDDGSISSYDLKTQSATNNYITLHTQAFDLETQNLLLGIIREKFNIIGCICESKGYYRICFNKDDTEKLINLVVDYIHPTMLYKVNRKVNNFIDLSNYKYSLYSTKITSIEKKILSSWTMYCFGVEDNHNFFANGVLTGNSFESEEVFNKRIEAGSEDGCVTRSAGMTNFTKYMPAGRRYYDLKNKPWMCNLPQYVNPKWDSNEKEKAVKKHGGEASLTYRIFVKGEVVEEGISVFDMEIVRRFYMEDKVIKKFEINKENYHNFKNILILDKPTGVQEVFLCADIGESAPTEIIVIFKVSDKYKYAYNITVYNLTDKQQSEIFSFIIQKLDATIVGLDTTDGTGRSIYRSLEEKYTSENLCWCAFNEKLSVGYERDENNNLKIDEKGNLIVKEEYVSEWSVKRLKDLFYEGLLLCPIDYKFDKQLNSVVCSQTGNRTVYEVVGDEDHLFSAFRVFAISEWHKQLKNLKPISTKKFAKSGV